MEISTARIVLDIHPGSISPLLFRFGSSVLERLISSWAFAPARTAGSVGMVPPAHFISIFSRDCAA